MSDDSEFEVLPADVMRTKYGLIAENRPRVCLDSANVPEALRHLIPLAERFGISDDLIRADFVGKVDPTELAALRQVVEEYAGPLDDWLAGPKADGPRFTAEYIAFTCMRMAADGC